jgi:hypothetical protein
MSAGFEIWIDGQCEEKPRLRKQSECSTNYEEDIESAPNSVSNRIWSETCTANKSVGRRDNGNRTDKRLDEKSDVSGEQSSPLNLPMLGLRRTESLVVICVA